MTQFGINVMDFGAKGDGIADDTPAIQAAINYASERGGGRILFPYTRGGYRLASPGVETYNGRQVRAQLVIPPEHRANIYLEGEMPCRMLNPYQIRPADCNGIYRPTRFGTTGKNNVRLFSDWDAPEVHDPTERPWAIIAAPEGDICKGHFSVSKFSIANLEFAVPLRKDKMYPTQSGGNFQNISIVRIYDSQFCLNEQIGDGVEGKELLENPCHTVGLMMSGDQSDHNVLQNVGVQGFKYGYVLGEMLEADYLYVENCEEGLVFHDASHFSGIRHVVAMHNRCVLSTTREKLFGHEKGPCYVKIDMVNFECGTGIKPDICQMKYGVYDPENRLHGSLCWHKPWGKQEFPAVGAENFEVKRF